MELCPKCNKPMDGHPTACVPDSSDTVTFNYIPKNDDRELKRWRCSDCESGPCYVEIGPFFWMQGICLLFPDRNCDWRRV